MCLYDIVQKSESSALSAERTVADAGEVAVGIEAVAFEHGHRSHVLHVAVLHDGIEDDLAMLVHVSEFLQRHRLKEFRHGEYRPGTEPTAHVVARQVVEHGVIWDAEDIVLQLLQVAYAAYLLMGLGVAEDQVSESHVLRHDIAQVDVHLL